MTWTPESLLAFEAEMAAEFEAGRIKAPLHLAGGNEAPLIELFRGVAPADWCLTSWRAHYHCLLKGVPPEQLRQAILDGRSIALCFPEQRVLSSAIVGGIAPIAVGLAWAVKRRGGNEHVWCFLGDMSVQGGLVHEAMKYTAFHDLPVRWIVEDNGMSVSTPTRAAWGADGERDPMPEVTSYRYTLSRPHVGTGKWVAF